MVYSTGQAATLLYSNRCPKCRFLSAVLVRMSIGMLRRVPIEGSGSAAFYDQHPEGRGYPALIDEERITTGPAVFMAVPLFVLRAWCSGLRHWVMRR